MGVGATDAHYKCVKHPEQVFRSDSLLADQWSCRLTVNLPAAPQLADVTPQVSDARRQWTGASASRIMSADVCRRRQHSSSARRQSPPQAGAHSSRDNAADAHNFQLNQTRSGPASILQSSPAHASVLDQPIYANANALSWTTGKAS